MASLNLKDNLRLALANKPLQYVLIAFLVGLAIYLVGSAAGKRAATGRQAKYPAGEQIPDSWVQNTAPGILRTLAEQLIGVSVLSGAKAAAIRPLLSVSNAQLVYLYNQYNTINHAGKPAETLYTDIGDDYFGSDLFEEGQLRTKVMERMLGLNLI